MTANTEFAAERHPCHWCNHPTSTVDHDTQLGCWCVECDNCFVEAELCDTEAEAVQAWNEGRGLQIIPRRVWSKVS